MPCRFLAIGECMVELSPLAEDRCAIGFAGDTFNTAWYVRQLCGVDALSVGYLSAVGDDALSRKMTDFMRQAGVEPEMHVIAGATVGLYMIFLQDGERSFQYWRSQSAARQLAGHLDALHGLARGDFAYLSGITLAILPQSGREALLSALQAASARGVRVVFDPNLRPRLWADTDEMCRVTMQGAALSDIVLPSFDDEKQWFGDEDQTATARRYLDAGSKLAVVKDGPGRVLVLGEGAPEAGLSVSPDAVAAPVDTTAAGDSFNAGFLSALVQGEDLDRAVRCGCDVAAQVVTQKGALVPVSGAGAGAKAAAAS